MVSLRNQYRSGSWLLVVAATVSMLSFSVQAAEAPLAECRGDFRTQVKGFHQTIASAGSSSRISIEADVACSDRFGRPYELRQVKLRILSEGQAPIEVSASRARWASRQGKLLISAEQGPTQLGSLSTASPIWVDFKAGILRSSDGTSLRF